MMMLLLLLLLVRPLFRRTAPLLRIQQIARLVLVGRHVARQVVPLAEALVAHRTLELLLALPPVRILLVLVLVVGPHVVHQVAGHPEADVALGTGVLGRQGERGHRGWQERREDGGGRRVPHHSVHFGAVGCGGRGGEWHEGGRGEVALGDGFGVRHLRSPVEERFGGLFGGRLTAEVRWVGEVDEREVVSEAGWGSGTDGDRGTR